MKCFIIINSELRLRMQF